METVASLEYVVRTSKNAIRDYVARLDGLERNSRELPALLRAITAEADVLSSALTRLSQHVSEVPNDISKHQPTSGTNLLEQAHMFFAAIENGFCPNCGGAISARH